MIGTNVGLSTRPRGETLQGPGDLGPVKESAIHREISNLFTGIERLQNVCGKLVDRIDPVLSPQGPESPTDAKSPAGATPLADQIHNAGTKIEALTEALIGVTNRVEL